MYGRYVLIPYWSDSCRTDTIYWCIWGYTDKIVVCYVFYWSHITNVNIIFIQTISGMWCMSFYVLMMKIMFIFHILTHSLRQVVKVYRSNNVINSCGRRFISISVTWLIFHTLSLLWRHNGPGSVPNHQPHDCLLNHLFRRRSEKTSKPCHWPFMRGIHRGPVNSPHRWPVTRKCFHLMT